MRAFPDWCLAKSDASATVASMKARAWSSVVGSGLCLALACSAGNGADNGVGKGASSSTGSSSNTGATQSTTGGDLNIGSTVSIGGDVNSTGGTGGGCQTGGADFVPKVP